MIKVYSIVFFLFGLQSNTQAQALLRSVIGASGGSNLVGNSHLSATVGQPGLTEVFQNGNTFLRQGFQQPMDFGRSSANVKKIKMLCYPNPMRTYFSIMFDKVMNLPFDVELRDLNGKVLFTAQNIKENQQLFIPDNLNQGIYMVRTSFEDGTEIISTIIRTR